MAGTKAGAEKRRQTMIAKAGGLDKYLEQQRAQAAKGGKGATGNFRVNRKLAKLAAKRSVEARKATYANEVDGQANTTKGVE